jgi:hypothetical protein
VSNIVKMYDESPLYVPCVKDYIYSANGVYTFRWNKCEYIFRIKDGDVENVRLVLNKNGKMFGSLTLEGPFKYYGGNGILKSDLIYLAVQYLWKHSENLLPDEELTHGRRRILKQQEENEEWSVPETPIKFEKGSLLESRHAIDGKIDVVMYISKGKSGDKHNVVLRHALGKPDSGPRDKDNPERVVRTGDLRPLGYRKQRE